MALTFRPDCKLVHLHDISSLEPVEPVESEFSFQVFDSQLRMGHNSMRDIPLPDFVDTSGLRCEKCGTCDVKRFLSPRCPLPNKRQKRLRCFTCEPKNKKYDESEVFHASFFFISFFNTF